MLEVLSNLLTQTKTHSLVRLTRMFWKYHSGAVSHVDTLLEKEGVTLQEILEQEDIIQECKNQNKKLVEL